MPHQSFDTLGEVRKRFPDLSYQPDFSDSARVFVKISHQACFRTEANGLEALRETDSIRIAQVIACGTADRHVLVIEAIESRRPSGDFFERFGYQLAQMHRSGSSDQFGFETNNFLGETAQPNPLTESWVEFWAQSRLGFQLRLAHRNGYGGKRLQRLGQQLINRLDALLGDFPRQPSLIHGDLWSGNWLCDESNDPVLIDPAVYYGDREAEFGMTTLFGGLPEAFYDAYSESWPMPDGWRDRVEIYRLYHVLNHLNLFGETYLPQAMEIMRKYC